MRRARYYSLNWLRDGNTIHWAPNFKYDETVGFGPFLEAVGAWGMRGSLVGNQSALGLVDMQDAVLKQVPLSEADQAYYQPLWTECLDSFALCNAELQNDWRYVTSGELHHIDLSTKTAVEAVVTSGVVRLQFSCKVGVARAKLKTWLIEKPWIEMIDLAVEADGLNWTVFLRPSRPDALRTALILQVWTADGVPFYGLRLRRSVGLN